MTDRIYEAPGSVVIEFSTVRSLYGAKINIQHHLSIGKQNIQAVIISKSLNTLESSTPLGVAPSVVKTYKSHISNAVGAACKAVKKGE